MIQLNKTIKTNNKIENAEGYDVYKEDYAVELFLQASNLKPTKEFYSDNKVKDFINFLNKLPKSETKFALALANYLNDQGLKLSPIVILNTLGREELKKYIKIFDRPDKIANYIMLSSDDDKKVFKNVTSKEKKALKKALENIKAFTLRKMQMKKKLLKTKDLIKMLRPKPKTDFDAKTYKEIIENRCKVETLLTKRSQNEEEAKEYFEENIDKMPVNMLIRNLRMCKNSSNPIETRNKILNRLMSMPIDCRLVNPFDFVNVAIEEPIFQLEMNELLNRFSKEANFDVEGKTAVMFDVSGSMQGAGETDGFKNLIVLNKFMKIDKLFFFNDYLKEDINGVLNLLNSGDIKEAKRVMRYSSGGTSLMNCFTNLTAKYDYDNIIIISDEVTWNDNYTIDAYKNVSKGKKIIAINPVHYQGTCFKNKFLALASIDAKIYLYLRLLVDFPKFRQLIIDNYYPSI